MGELKGYTCSCDETKQDTDTRGFAPFALGSNLPSAFASTPNSSGISSPILVFANNSHQPNVVADSGVTSPSLGKKPFGGATSAAANTSAATSNCSFVNNPSGQISPLGQWGKSTAAKADISTTTATNPFAPSGMTTACPFTTTSSTNNPFAPPLQSHSFSFNNSMPSHNTPAFSLLSTEDRSPNHGWKPVFDNNSSNQGIGLQASFQKSTGMTSHSQTPSLGGGGIPPPSTKNAQTIPAAPTFTDLVGPKTPCICKSPFPESNHSPSFKSSCSPFKNPTSFLSVPSFQESMPFPSGPFSFKCSSSLFKNPTFFLGMETSTNSPFLTQYPKEGPCSILSISAIPINEDKSHEELRLEYYLSQGKVTEQNDTASSKVTPYPVYPFIPVMMLPSMVMLPLVPNLNAAYNVPSWAASTGFPAGSYPLFSCYGAPSIHGPPIFMLAVDPHQSITSRKS